METDCNRKGVIFFPTRFFEIFQKFWPEFFYFKKRKYFLKGFDKRWNDKKRKIRKIFKRKSS